MKNEVFHGRLSRRRQPSAVIVPTSTVRSERPLALNLRGTGRLMLAKPDCQAGTVVPVSAALRSAPVLILH